MAWLTAINALLTLGATARLTRLVTTDTITRPLRTWLDRKASPKFLPRETDPDTGEDVGFKTVPAPAGWKWASELVGCPWCIGLWLSFGMTLALWQLGCYDAYTYVVYALSVSHAVALADAWFDSPPPVRQIRLEPAALDVTVHKPIVPGAPPAQQFPHQR